MKSKRGFMENKNDVGKRDVMLSCLQVHTNINMGAANPEHYTTVKPLYSTLKNRYVFHVVNMENCIKSAFIKMFMIMKFTRIKFVRNTIELIVSST